MGSITQQERIRRRKLAVHALGSGGLHRSELSPDERSQAQGPDVRLSSAPPLQEVTPTGLNPYDN